MRTSLFTAVSAIALMMAAPAVGEQNQATDAERRWERTQETISEAVQSAEETIEETYFDIRNTAEADGETDDVMTVKISATAQGMIGKDVYDANGEAVASIEDIIINEDGEAQLVVLRDGGFFGMGGKLVALDYDEMVRTEETGDIMMPVSEDMLDQVAAFSYEGGAAGEGTNVRVTPAGGLSVSQMLDGNLLNSQVEVVANVDNVAFADGQARYVFVSFNDFLGMGGDTAIVDFEELELSRERQDAIDFRMTDQQSAEFESLKENMERRG